MLLWLLACRLDPRLAGRDLDLTATDVSAPGPFVPPACYARTRRDDGTVRNPCWTCHQQPLAPNFVDDRDLQLSYAFPTPLLENPWRTPATAVDWDDDAVLAWIREDNYLDDHGEIALATTLARVPPGWDADHDGTWDGFVPDLRLRADARGWDREPDGVPTGWRAYRYTPLPGAFWPTNGGSWGDGWIRLPAPYRSTADSAPDLAVYETNLAILEAAIRGAPVGYAGRELPPAPARSDQRWAGLAGVQQDQGLLAPPTAGLFPVGTELLHGLRYLDPSDGQVRPAARTKELRYLRKTTATTYASLAEAVAEETREEAAFPDRVEQVQGDVESGAFTGTGWRISGFVEDARGELRPQTLEETAFCVGCHGGVGAGVDSTFSFARKIPGDDGWGADPRGDRPVPDLLRADGRWEAALYLETTGTGDDFAVHRAPASSPEDLRPTVLPDPERALALDRAYLGIVAAQSYARGRDPSAALPEAAVHDVATADEPTGIEAPVPSGWIRGTQ